HHQPMTLLVTNVSELGDVRLDLRPQGLGQHPPRTLSDDLVDYRRRSRPRRTRTIAVSRIRNYSEHRVVPSRPALSAPVLLGTFHRSPGKVRPIPSRSTDFKHCSHASQPTPMPYWDCRQRRPKTRSPLPTAGKCELFTPTSEPHHSRRVRRPMSN